MVEQAELERRRLVVEFIKTRKDELRYSWLTIAQKARRVESFIRRIVRQPEKYAITPDTAIGLDIALELEPGSIERMLAGKGDPVRLPGTPGAAPTAPAGAPRSMIDILRKWNRRLTPEDAVELADDMFIVMGAAKVQGYDQGFEDGRAVLREAESGPASPPSNQPSTTQA